MPKPIKLPSLSPTMEEAALIKWRVAVGDTVKSGDIIAEVETDKAVMDLEAIDEGIVGELIVSEGTQGIPVNSDIALLLAPGEELPVKRSVKEIPDVALPDEDYPRTKRSSGYDAVFPDEQDAGSTGNASQTLQIRRDSVALQEADAPDTVRATPLAKRLARQFKLDLTLVSGTGPHGRIVREDVEKAARAGTASLAKRQASRSGHEVYAATPLAAYEPLYRRSDYELVPLNSMRKTIASRMTAASRDIPHFPLTVDCEIDALLEQRKKLNDDRKHSADGLKISLNDFVMRAAALSLIKVPEVNSSYTDDGIMKHKHADIAVAVAMRDGLITPIVRRCEEKGLEAIAREVRDLAARAKEKRLKPEEYQGGTFSISNMGMFGLKDFVSIINPPHGAILSIGAVSERAVSRNRTIYSAMVMSVTLVCDHRVIDGLPAAEFIEQFKAFMENPTKMLL